MSDPSLLPEIRNAVRAVILRQGEILMLRKRRGDDFKFALPGGAQDPGETLVDALVRECREEIAAVVEVGELIHVADYFKPRATEPPTTRHLVEFLFRCSVPAGYRPQSGHHPDKSQVGVEWVALDDLARLTVTPPGYAAVLGAAARLERPAGYLGTID